MPGAARELLGVPTPGCHGYRLDDTIVTVSPDNVRQMVDTSRPRFVQSALRCVGPGPLGAVGTAQGTAQTARCDDAAVRADLRCRAPDFSRGLADLLPYARVILQPLISQRINTDVFAEVLPWYARAWATRGQLHCAIVQLLFALADARSKVLAVDKSSDVVRAARDFFAYRGAILSLTSMHFLHPTPPPTPPRPSCGEEPQLLSSPPLVVCASRGLRGPVVLATVFAPRDGEHPCEKRSRGYDLEAPPLLDD
ncbi:unnamed protein product [Symbiodinium natans]|uniref:Uncharacterized protein n=1 Tax=Symbiodinium natans TaxID=878477 RepID=A0A812R7M4_9DINO|nr:unnamed protein product [Symbiodinium natans]